MEMNWDTKELIDWLTNDEHSYNFLLEKKRKLLNCNRDQLLRTLKNNCSVGEISWSRVQATKVKECIQELQ